jgi:alcohol dehydrogenase class IV
MSQGANPWSDLGCREAMRLLGQFLERAVKDASDAQAREQMMWAATLAGIAFGNAGVHAPHGMAYAVAGRVRDFRPLGYPAGEPLVPHGMAVIVNAPSVFRFTAAVSPQRHLEAARLLGADTQGAGPEDAGEVLATEIIRIMRAVGMPNGLGGVGYSEDDVAALTEGTYPQQRILQNAPREMSKPILAELFRHAIRYW